MPPAQSIALAGRIDVLAGIASSFWLNAAGKAAPHPRRQRAGGIKCIRYRCTQAGSNARQWLQAVRFEVGAGQAELVQAALEVVT
jgi:hypothetical protein